MIIWIAAIAALGLGLLLGGVISGWLNRRRMALAGPELLPADVPHVVDLLRRAHDAWAVCFVAGDISPIWSVSEPRAPTSLLDRTEAVARLAMGDSRDHVVREGHAIVAAGDGELGTALLMGFQDVTEDDIGVVAGDLRRMLAEVTIERRRQFGVLDDPRRIPEWVVNGADSLEGLAFALCEAVRHLTGRASAVVMRQPSSPIPTVIAVSRGTDRRLLSRSVTLESAAGRAIAGDVPVIGTDTYDLFGRSPNDRRRHTEPGIAFPLRSGREGVGALIVFGSHQTLESTMRERIIGISVDAGPRLGAAAHIRAAETRATTDPLTGLPNRLALERAVEAFTGAACSLLYADLDHFKELNDSFGHPSGDEALRHVARVFQRSLREDDIAARIGGEEFGLWLPGTPLADAREVAERVRQAVESAILHIGGVDFRLTCSIGIAAVPDTVAKPANLTAAADAALYQAKSRGRNRVEVAQGRG